MGTGTGYRPVQDRGGNFYPSKVVDREQVLANAGAQHARQLANTFGQSHVLLVGLDQACTMFCFDAFLLLGFRFPFTHGASPRGVGTELALDLSLNPRSARSV